MSYVSPLLLYGRGVGVILYQMISGRLPFIPARVCTSKPVSFPAAVWWVVLLYFAVKYTPVGYMPPQYRTPCVYYCFLYGID